MREAALKEGIPLETEIPLPGLPDSRSQLAVAIEAFGRLIGVLYADSPQELRFGYDEEDALVAVAGQLGTAIHHLQQLAEDEADQSVAPTAGSDSHLRGKDLTVRHLEENDSIFLGDDYLIKGVAGAILWALVS